MTYSIWANASTLVEKVKNFDVERIEGFAKVEWLAMTNSCSSFHGEKGTAGVIEDFYGPHEHEARITSKLESEILSDEMFKKRFSFVNRQTSGQRVDIPRYLNGDPRYWFTVKKKRTKVPSVRVYAPMGGRGYVSEKEMDICGATTCAIVEMLESNGVNVELWATCCAEGVFSINKRTGEKDQSHICHMIKIKDSGDYTDYGMINYITGNSHFYRNIIFKDRIMSSLGREDIGYSGVGGSYNFSKGAIPIDEEYASDLDIVVPRCYSIDAAKRYIEENFLSGNSLIEQSHEAANNKEEDPCA